MALAAGTAVKAGLTTKRAHREGYGETFTSTEDQGSMGVQAFMPTRKSFEKLSSERSFPRPSPTQTTIMQRLTSNQYIRISHETAQSPIQRHCTNQRPEQQVTTPTSPISRTYKTRSAIKRYQGTCYYKDRSCKKHENKGDMPFLLRNRISVCMPCKRRSSMGNHKSRRDF